MDNMESMAKDSPAPVDPMEYRDLLIFEESLRNQYLYLQRRRRKYLGNFPFSQRNECLANIQYSYALCSCG